MNKRLFDMMMKLQVKAAKTLRQFNLEEEIAFGFTRNDQDLDELIDAIDYAGGGITYDRYIAVMGKRKSELLSEQQEQGKDE